MDVYTESQNDDGAAYVLIPADDGGQWAAFNDGSYMRYTPDSATA